MKIIAEIFSQGEEVVTGQTLDTNATWLSQQLNDMGFKVSRHTTVGDKLNDLANVFTEISQRADFCICTGGLGPTSDDLTAEALSLASGLTLEFDAEAFLAIESYFVRRNRLMPVSNRKQAYLPVNSTRIDNPVGTAPGFACQFDRCWFVCLPGVPTEMQAMFFQSVLPQLPQKFAQNPERLISLRTVGIGESAIQQCLKDFRLPHDVGLGFRAALGEVQVKLLFPNYYSESVIELWTFQLKQLLGDCVYAINGFDEQPSDLLTVINREMLARQSKLILIESISYGLIAQRCFGYQWLNNTLLVHPESSDESGYQSAMASVISQYPEAIIVSQLCKHTLDEISDVNQTILLSISLVSDSFECHKEVVLAGSLDYKQQQAAIHTLDFLRRYLFNLCL